MIDPLRRYSDAQIQFDEANEQLRSLGKYIAEIARELEREPLELMLTDIQPIFPAEIAASLPHTTLKVDGRRWPTASEFQNQLIDLHKALENFASAWAALSPTERKTVKGLPRIDEIPF